ncbi:hypothetical protein [Pseudoalteromonas gelatinilytica]|uniref:hypothetical protein n=1 Tax=Pseudoalteromonas gelatinilytica TaxID=1703256 RepID=UPI0007C5A774|nr:hypothetical protein [Pseudoalteromonas gelatinilytica]
MTNDNLSVKHAIQLKPCCINIANCLELGLSTPKKYEKQINYVLRLLLTGYSINTRMARYIGIYNLHSILSKLKKRGVPFTIDHVKAYCPLVQEVISNPVDKAYMSFEQVSLYKEKANTAQTVLASNSNTGGDSLATNHQPKKGAK